MKRAKPIQRKTRLKSVNRERAAKRKARDFGEYAEWVRLRVCLVWGRVYEVGYPGSRTVTIHHHECLGRVEAHHVRTRGARGQGAGNLLPLCHRAHIEEWHGWGRKTWAKRYDLDPGAIAADLWGRYQAEKGNNAA